MTLVKWENSPRMPPQMWSNDLLLWIAMESYTQRSRSVARPRPTHLSLMSVVVWLAVIVGHGIIHSVCAASERKTYTIGFLPANTSLNANHAKGGKYYLGAFQYALGIINAEETYPFKLRAEIRDNKGETFESIRQVTSLYNEGVIAYIGPEDTCNVEGRMAAAFNLPMVAYVST